MTYNYDFLIASMVFLMIIFFHFYNSHKLPDLNTTIFRILIFVGIIDIIFDAITSLLISAQIPDLNTVAFIAQTIFYLMQVTIPYVVFLYSCTLGRALQDVNRNLLVILSIPALVIVMVVLLNIFTGCIFYFDCNGVYIHGPWYYSTYMYSFLYVVITLATSIANFPRLGGRNFIIICEYILIMVVCIAVQAVYSDLLTTSLGIGLGLTLLYLTINNPSGYIDSLTGDFNMQSFRSWTKEMFRRKKSFHLIVVDLLELKKINLLFGVHFGDEFLTKISAMLREIAGKHFIFRISSKRFIVAAHQEYLYENILSEIERMFQRSIFIDDEKIQLNGVVCGIKDAHLLGNSDELLSYTDYLSESAEDSSTSHTIKNSSAAWDKFHYTKEIERYLRIAIKDNLFEIYYQPIYSLDKNGYVSLEALSRLKHPTLGPIPPDTFIQIAERSGQITQLEYLQIRRVCGFVSEHPELLSSIHHINFNLSPADLLLDDFSQHLIEIIREFNLPFSFFRMEITETVATEYSDKLYALANDFKKHGILMCLDDFGSGYANLNTVLKLPFSCIKLDRSLLHDILTDANAELFYKNIVSALRGMHYNVISEGVEQPEEVELLRSFGVNMIQGYYFAKPLQPQELLELLAEESTAFQK